MEVVSALSLSKQLNPAAVVNDVSDLQYGRATGCLPVHAPPVAAGQESVGGGEFVF